MSTVMSYASPERQPQSQLDDDPRPSSTSVVATLRHSPRLLLRKSASALKEPPQSPDIFARGAGPSLRASTRLQTRNTSARLMNARSKKSTRQLQQQQQQQQQQVQHDTQSNSAARQSSQYTTVSMTSNTNSLSVTITSTSHTTPEDHRESNDVVMENAAQTRSLRSLSASGIAYQPPSSLASSPTSPASDLRSTSIATEETNGSSSTSVNGERRSRIATRSASHTRESTRSRSSRTRARTRAVPVKPLKGLRAGLEEEEQKSDEDDDDDDTTNRYHLRSPSHPHRRPRSIQKRPSPELSSTAVSDISRLTLAPRLTRLGARHESGHDFDDEPEQEQELAMAHRSRPQHPTHMETDKSSKQDQDGRRSRSSTGSTSSNQENKPVSTAMYTSSGTHVAPKKTKKKSVDLHKVPSLPSSRRRLRARTTKIAKMGIDKRLRGGVEDDDDIEDDGEDEDEDEDEEEYDSYPRSDQDDEMTDVQQLPSGLSLRLPVADDTTGWNQSDGFIASKPEAPLSTVAGGGGAFGYHAKRKVGDEDMEDLTASISLDEGQVVSTKLARIDETADSDKNGYMKTFYSMIKSPRDEDDDGILSSESEDADLESEDDDDDFEEIDVWEFIATLPPLGPLPSNFAFTMPERDNTTPPITLVLDIDETLVHCATRPLDSPDMIFPVEYNHETWEVYGRIRPGMHEFLEKMSTKFEVITFTASQECYAEALLKLIDPDKKYIKHRYYRDSCVPVFGNYVKDLRILNRDLSKVIIIDNSPQAFGYQISNGIPIESWYDDKSDRELAKVMEFLESLEGVEDVRPKIDEQYKLQERIQRALAMASQHQLAGMNALGGLGATLGSTSGSISASIVEEAEQQQQQPHTESNNSSGANSLASLQSVMVPDNNIDMDTNMDDTEKLVSASDEDEDEDSTERVNTRGRRRRAAAAAVNKGSSGPPSHDHHHQHQQQHHGRVGTTTMTMKTRSNSLDMAKISL
ncbi:hypothetical protein BGZ83_003984 [Gryganskiella cystojenkinii]|nr:hypothetical protein BGZ83_003984 [Gryganskiella cystojenkinii]